MATKSTSKPVRASGVQSVLASGERRSRGVECAAWAAPRLAPPRTRAHQCMHVRHEDPMDGSSGRAEHGVEVLPYVVSTAPGPCGVRN